VIRFDRIPIEIATNNILPMETVLSNFKMKGMAISIIPSRLIGLIIREINS